MRTPRPRISQARFRAMVESGFDAFELLDASGRILYLSPSGGRILGYEPGERVGRSAFELLHPDDAPAARAAFDRLRSTPGSRAVIEFRFRQKDGTWRYCEGAGTNLLGDPAVNALVLSFRDVTARKLTEESVRRLAYGMSGTGQALFEAVVRHLVEALGADYGLIGELRDGNASVTTIASFGPGPFKAGDVYDLAGTPCERVMNAGPCTIARGVSALFPGDALLRQMQGEGYVGSPVFDRQRRPIGIMVVISLSPLRDAAAAQATLQLFATRVSSELQRLHDEQQLRASEARYRALLDEASDGIVVFGDEGPFQETNPGLCAMLGYTRDELLAMHPADIIEPADLEREPINWDMLRSGLVRIVERRMVRKGGGIVPVETKTRRMQDGRYLSIVRDITERRQAEEALAALRDRDEQLRQAQKIEAIGRLAGGVAHDFNNVLTAIMGYADLLLDEFRVDDPRRQDLAEIKKAAERAAGLTRQLLAFSRKQVLQPVILDLNAIVGGIDKLLRRLIGDDVEFTFEADDDLGRVVADPGQIEQVLINLTVNARDAMPEGGRLRIATRNVSIGEADAQRLVPLPPGEYVTLQVADTGHGIRPEVLPHIFEPFFTTKPQGRGTGLGLATVYGIVKQSDGFIFVDSDAGQGATFTVYLPRTQAGAAIAEARGAVSSHPVVLLVEDEAAVRALAAGVLRRQGLTVLEAPSASAALETAHDQPRLDLLLTDIVMPGGTGDELARRLRQLRPDLKVIYMSGFSDERVRHASALSGIPFVQKPFTPHALVKVVSETLTISP